MIARVSIDDVPVGRIVLDPDSNRATFWFNADYVARSDRPVLGRYFEDRELTTTEPFRGKDAQQLHEYFLNALPEGALRKVLETAMVRRTSIDFDLLCKLGSDLPGCLRVVPDLLDAESAEPPSGVSTSDADPTRPDPLRFSLAGVQLKASVLRSEQKINLPLIGRGGNWIAKFPSAVIAHLPENEHTILTWARACGIDVSANELVRVQDIENLPEAFPREGRALLVERFDRRDGKCIHQEDFSQVFGIHPLDKFMNQVPDEISYASLARLVDRLTDGRDTHEYLRRLAFMLLSGNTDAHIKNWAFIYPDAIHPRLAPAYDLVCVEPYGQDTLALAWGPPLDPNHTPEIPLRSIGREDFRVVARYIGHSEQSVLDVIDSFVAKATSTWATVRESPDVPGVVREMIDERMGRGGLGPHGARASLRSAPPT